MKRFEVYVVGAREDEYLGSFHFNSFPFRGVCDWWEEVRKGEFFTYLNGEKRHHIFCMEDVE